MKVKIMLKKNWKKTESKKMTIAKKMDQMSSKIMASVSLLILIFFFLFLWSFVFFQYFRWPLYSFTKKKVDLIIQLLKASNLNYLYIQWAILVFRTQNAIHGSIIWKKKTKNFHVQKKKECWKLFIQALRLEKKKKKALKDN